MRHRPTIREGRAESRTDALDRRSCVVENANGEIGRLEDREIHLDFLATRELEGLPEPFGDQSRDLLGSGSIAGGLCVNDILAGSGVQMQFKESLIVRLHGDSMERLAALLANADAPTWQWMPVRFGADVSSERDRLGDSMVPDLHLAGVEAEGVPESWREWSQSGQSIS